MQPTTANKFTWSYSALDCFEQCPRKYYHQYILREKEPPTPSLIKGREDHESCEKFMKGEIPTPPYPIVQTVKNRSEGRKLYVEQKMGLSQAMGACDFFGREVWGRAASDVILIRGDTAVLIDWKTGKNREGTKYWAGPTQLTIMALFMFKHFPDINKITALNIYLEVNKSGEAFTFTRDQEPELWAKILPRIQRMEQTVRTNTYCMMPGPLCAYCPVRSCPNNRS